MKNFVIFGAVFILALFGLGMCAYAQQPVQIVSPQNLNTGQVSVGTTATLVRNSQPARRALGVTVTTAVQCAFGGPGVALTTGYLLQATAGASVTIDSSAAIYGVCASTATVAWMEPQ